LKETLEAWRERRRLILAGIDRAEGSRSTLSMPKAVLEKQVVALEAGRRGGGGSGPSLVVVEFSTELEFLGDFAIPWEFDSTRAVGSSDGSLVFDSTAHRYL
jgi:hypothetical protein